MTRPTILRLADLTTSIDYGLTASAVEGEGPKFLRITDLQDDSVNWSKVPSCVCTGKDLERYALFDGDIVFARTGATTGKSYLINSPPFRSVFASYLIRVRPNNKINAPYLAHFFQSQNYWHQISNLTEGAAQPGVNASKLANLKIPVPKLEEQERISILLDKTSTIRKKRRESLKLADEFLRSVFLDMFGDPVTNPKGWPKEELGSLTTKIGSGATPLGGDSVYQISGISFIRSMNVYDRSFLMDDLAYLDDMQATKLSNVEVQSGDLLLNITGASVARSCLVPDEILPARVNQHVCIVRLDGQLVPEFLEAQIVCESVKKILLGIGESMGATRQAITKAQLEKFKVVVPPKSMQIRYANIVNKIQRQKSNMQIFLGESEFLIQSLQQQAFS